MPLLKSSIHALFLAGLCAASAGAQAVTELRTDATTQVPIAETGYFRFGTARSRDGHAIGINSRYLSLDGKPWLPAMGEIHFSRVPNRYWREELEKTKTAGISIVSTYVFWNHHEETQGRFVWSGDRDLRHFVELCRASGLKVVVRIGPWVHAESRFGGLPDWVVRAMPTRRSDPAYLAQVARYWGEIATQLKGLLWKDGGPVIGIQLENEYNLTGPGQGRAHIADLKRIALQAGLDVPLYTVTGWDNTVFPEHEVVPVEGGYPDQPWSLSHGKLPPAETYAFRFDDRVAGNLGAETANTSTGAGDAERDAVHTPFLGAEFGGGLPTMYRRRPLLEPDDIAAMLPVELGSGVNLYGYYMFHGGQNSPDRDALEESTAAGGYNDLPMIDYDFQAPLGAYGQQHPVLRRLRPFHYFLNAFGADLAPMTVHAPDTRPKDTADLSTPRFALRSAGDSGFLFVNNHVRQYAMEAQRGVRFQIQLPHGAVTFPSRPIDIASNAYFIWPVNMALGGARLVYATAQPVTRIAADGVPLYVFRAVSGIPVEFALSGVSDVSAPSGQVTRDRDGIVVSDVGPGTMLEAKTASGNVRLLVLAPDDADRLSLVEFAGHARLVLSDAQVYRDGADLVLLSTGDPTIAFSIYPPLPKTPGGSLALRQTARDGVFQTFAATAQAKTITPSLAKLRDALPVPPPPMTGPEHTAAAPVPETFGRSAAWTLSLPKDALDGVEDVFLRIEARGDVARLFSGTTMLDDRFLDGAAWEIGLKRFAAQLAKPLTLTVLPMRRDSPVYLEHGIVQMVDGEQTAQVLKVDAVAQYALRLRDGGGAARRRRRARPS